MEIEMTKEYKPINNLQELAAAQAAGHEIEYRLYNNCVWCVWENKDWNITWKFRSRPRPTKRTVWVNLYKSPDEHAYYYSTQFLADEAADPTNPRIGNRAWPLEIME
jgi:hypothetical protein